MTKQLECRIVIIHHSNRKVEVGMYDPVSSRYEPLGTHGPNQKEVEKVIYDLKKSIEKVGHLLTFCERSA